MHEGPMKGLHCFTRPLVKKTVFFDKKFESFLPGEYIVPKEKLSLPKTPGQG